MNTTKRTPFKGYALGIILLGTFLCCETARNARQTDAHPGRQDVAGPALLVSPSPAPSATTPIYSYRIVKAYPHDPKAFTQGLIFDEGFLYESTGMHGQSTLRKVELETGKVLKQYALPAQYFGEGLTIWKNQLIQLTWQSQIGFVYDKETFRPLKNFRYSTEGWGLTQDGKRLILSDGTATLYFLNPDTFQEVGRIGVRDRNGPVSKLNELEYVKGEIYANVWQTDRIARIAPQTGQVLGWIDLSGLLSAEERVPPVDVLNGIAYDAARDRLFVTGKYWPILFEIELVGR